MQTERQLWLQWANGEIDDNTAQARAEAIRAAKTLCRPMQRSDREKTFGPGRCIPLDRNAKVRVMMYARGLMRRTDAGKHYGVVTAKFIAVLGALLWGFHNAGSGRCFPSYEAIADRAGCARSTVYEAIRALERAGVLTWVNRLLRVREAVDGLFGARSATRWRVIRTSNAYAFYDPKTSKSDFTTGTPNQGFKKHIFLMRPLSESAKSAMLPAQHDGLARNGPGN